MMQSWNFYISANFIVIGFSIPLSFNDIIAFTFGIILFSVLCLSIFVNERYVAKLGDHLYKNNLKLFVITLLVYTFFLIFPAITIVT